MYVAAQLSKLQGRKGFINRRYSAFLFWLFHNVCSFIDYTECIFVMHKL